MSFKERIQANSNILTGMVFIIVLLGGVALISGAGWKTAVSIIVIATALSVMTVYRDRLGFILKVILSVGVMIFGLSYGAQFDVHSPNQTSLVWASATLFYIMASLTVSYLVTPYRSKWTAILLGFIVSFITYPPLSVVTQVYMSHYAITAPSQWVPLLSTVLAFITFSLWTFPLLSFSKDRISYVDVNVNLLEKYDGWGILTTKPSRNHQVFTASHDRNIILMSSENITDDMIERFSKGFRKNLLQGVFRTSKQHHRGEEVLITSTKVKKTTTKQLPVADSGETITLTFIPERRLKEMLKEIDKLA